MQITSIKIRRIFDEGAMRAIVSVTLDDVLAIHDIKVICARGKYFIVMPSRKMPDETFRDIVHPITAEFRSQLEEAVLAEYAKEAQRVRDEAHETETHGDGVQNEEATATDGPELTEVAQEENVTPPPKRKSFFGFGF